MEGYKILYSGAIRFNDDLNIGIYYTEEIENPGTYILFVVDENTGTILMPTD